MNQPHSLATRLLTLRNQIKASSFFLILALLAASFTLLKGMNSLRDVARENAQAQDATNHLYSIDKKLFDDASTSKAKLIAAESIADDIAALRKLGKDEERLGQLQTLAERWANTQEDATPLMRGQIKDLLRMQGQFVVESQAQADKLYRETMIAASLLVVLLGLALVLFHQHVAHRITEPVQQMLVAMERLAGGDVAPQVEARSHDELGQLAFAFNAMAEQLSQRQAATLSRNRELDELYYFNTMLQTSESEAEIHRALLQKVRPLQLSQAVVLDWETESSSLLAVATLYPLPETKPDGSAMSYQIPLCRVVRAGREMMVRDLREDLICNACHFGQQNGSAFCLPMIAGGKPIGALHLISPQIDYWTVEHQRFIKALVDQAGSAINNLRLRDQLEGRVFMDEHTQVYNRSYLDDHLRKQFAAAEREQRPLSVMMLDIDFFKRFNDTYGHEAGDIVLRQFAKAIKGALREHEVFARYGGEEFTIVMHGTAREAQVLAERLRRAVAALSFKQFTTTGEEVRITMSIGIAEFPSIGHTLEELLKSADMALYSAKDSGRNCVKVATKALLAVRAAKQ